MKKLLILGAGTGGTIMANKLAGDLNSRDWQITIVDEHEIHHYQPGFLFIPFGIYSCEDVVKPKRDYLPSQVEVVISPINEIKPHENRVLLENGRVLEFDVLIVATGSRTSPEETDGMLGDGWRTNIFDFYTLDGACALRDFLNRWAGGHLVMNVIEMPIKCPVAPLEFVFLADWWFTEQGLRDRVEIEYVTPLPGAFTKPIAAKHLGDFLDKKQIRLTSEFNTGRVEAGENKIVSWDEREVSYDLLVTVPTNKGSEAVARSGMGDELNFVPTDPRTLQSKNHDNVFVIGDASDVPTSKAGSVTHFMSDVLHENILRYIDGRELKADFDGHANCFIESGFGKGLLIDFNYDVEPLPGKYPLPGIGPFTLLEESRINHWGKMAFRWIYYNQLLMGSDMLLDSQMYMAGKRP